jgi:hypothetical protein
MLTEMLKIVTDTHHDRHTLYDRANVLHPIRVMTAMRSNDVELNCIALGHELLNKTSVTVDDLVIAGMSDRVIRGIILFKDAGTPAQTLDNISSTYDTIRVAMPCLLDRGAFADTKRMNKKSAAKIEDYREAYMRMAALLRGAEHCHLLGLKHPFFS